MSRRYRRSDVRTVQSPRLQYFAFLKFTTMKQMSVICWIWCLVGFVMGTHPIRKNYVLPMRLLWLSIMTSHICLHRRMSIVQFSCAISGISYQKRDRRRVINGIINFQWPYMAARIVRLLFSANHFIRARTFTFGDNANTNVCCRASKSAFSIFCPLILLSIHWIQGGCGWWTLLEGSVKKTLSDRYIEKEFQ